MRHLALAWLGVAGLLGGAVLALGAPAPVAAEDICGPSAPANPGAIRGQAWIGVVVDIERHEPRNPARYDWAAITFRIEQVVRDAPRMGPGTVRIGGADVITLRVGSCDGHRDLGLQRGGRYLVSTRAILEPGDRPGTGFIFASMTVAWELYGDVARLQDDMYYRDWRDELWPGFAEADTLADVLAIVAPNAPATDALAGPQPGPEPPWGLALLAGIPGAWLVLRRTRRRA